MLVHPLRHRAAQLSLGALIALNALPSTVQAAASQPDVPPAQNAPAAALAERPVVRAIYTPGPISLDDDRTSGVWAAAPAYPLGFSIDKRGAQVAEPGNVRFFWSDTHLYAAFEMTDRDVIQESDKDQDHHYRTGDVVELFLKPDGGNWYWEFYATPNAKRTAFFYPGRGRLSLPSTLEDYSHSRIAVSAAVDGQINNWHTVDNGWIGLMAIPLEELGAPGIPLQTGDKPNWRVLAARYNFGQQLSERELSSYPSQSRTSFHMYEEWAPLELVAPQPDGQALPGSAADSGKAKPPLPLLKSAAEVALPPLLTTTAGEPVTTAQQWQDTRRPELLELFRQHVYGRAPVARPDDLAFTASEPREVFDGLGTCRKIDITYSGPHGEGALPFKLYTPNGTEPPKGVFVYIFVRQRQLFDSAESDPTGFWPIKDLLQRGYATAAFFKDDAAIDNKDTPFSNGPFPAYEPQGEPRADDAWGTIAAWSWSASRVIDVIEQIPGLAGLPVAVVGHSRGGKAALWAGAQDERVSLTVSNNSGNTGAALSRTTRGESVATINSAFPHWFARNYSAYNEDVSALPLDQHALIALIAPRLVYIASASEDRWADPQSEFQSAREASAVYELLGARGMARTAQPPAGDRIHTGHIGYHLRKGPHDLTSEDWQHFIDFAERHWYPSEPPLPAGTIGRN